MTEMRLDHASAHRFGAVWRQRLTELDDGFCRKVRFLGKIQKSGIRNSMTYRLPNSRKSNFATEPDIFVKLNDQIEGLTYLLTLGVRVLTVMEFALRRSLQNDHAKLPGLHPENKTKMTDTPTAERILKAFANVSLTIIKQAAGEGILRRLTPLSGVQEAILQRLGLGTNLYRQLEMQNMES